MSSEEDLLGMYIPTYNREPFLNSSLDCIIEQIRGFNFPIYISDNNSTDRTQELVKDKQSIYDRIFYQRNETNLGYAGNVLKVIEMGKSDYIWLFGDDDLLYTDSINAIIDKLQKKPDFLFINSSVFDRKMYVEFKHKVINIEKDVVIISGEHNNLLDLIAKMDKNYLGFMGAIIIRRDRLLSTLKETTVNKNSEFIHMPLFYQSICGANGIILEKPIIKIRGGNYRTNMLTWLWEFPNAISTLTPYYSKNVLIKFYNFTFQYDMFLSVIEHRYRENFSPIHLIEVLKEKGTYANQLTKIASILGTLIPYPIFRRIFFIIKKVKSSI